MRARRPSDAETGRTIVICCYTEDRWDRLVRSVESAITQAHNGDEVVVVVDYNDRLYERATEAFSPGAQVVPNRHEQGLSGARNTGVEKAAGGLILFLDDDAQAEPGWLDALTAPFTDPSVVGVGGAAIPDWAGGEPPSWMPDEFYWVVGCSYRGLPTTGAPIRNPIGCNMAFRADAIRRVNGFSPTLGRVSDLPMGGEETDLAIRISAATGGRILYVPTAVVLHAVEAPRMTWTYFTKRCFWEGASKAILAGRVGAAGATSSERAYLGTLTAGVARRVGESVRSRSFIPIVQAVAMAAGLALTTIGFGFAGIRSMAGRRQ